jgi:Flp pilus assembly protein TadG
MVEFSLILPVLLLVLVGLSDIPRAVLDYNVISNAAREGAREAVLVYNQCQNTAPCSTPPSGSSIVGVQTAIKRAGAGYLTYTFVDTSGASSVAPACTPSANQGCVWVFAVDGSTTTGCTPPNPVASGGTDTWSLCDFNRSKRGGSSVVVEIEYQYAPFTPLLANAFGNSTILWAKSEMKTEY